MLYKHTKHVHRLNTDLWQGQNSIMEALKRKLKKIYYRKKKKKKFLGFFHMSKKDHVDIINYICNLKILITGARDNSNSDPKNLIKLAISLYEDRQAHKLIDMTGLDSIIV